MRRNSSSRGRLSNCLDRNSRERTPRFHLCMRLWATCYSKLSSLAIKAEFHSFLPISSPVPEGAWRNSARTPRLTADTSRRRRARTSFVEMVRAERVTVPTGVFSTTDSGQSPEKTERPLMAEPGSSAGACQSPTRSRRELPLSTP